jgi:hypothetical protein
MSTWRPARLLLWVEAAAVGASLFTFATARIAEADLSGVVALRSSPTPAPRNLEDALYSDIHPATPDQQLSKPLEK